eukprot:GHUV01034650.1.p1 GENE.GHUV01034650.1~~GHUV01034650.1.p1  ORF type:complete len:268 (+),score=38.78 GHUV01034650.1:368-1171(+)
MPPLVWCISLYECCNLGCKVRLELSVTDRQVVQQLTCQVAAGQQGQQGPCKSDHIAIQQKTACCQFARISRGCCLLAAGLCESHMCDVCVVCRVLAEGISKHSSAAVLEIGSRVFASLGRQLSPYIAFVDQGINQFQCSSSYADICILHAVNNGGSVPLDSLVIYCYNLKQREHSQGEGVNCGPGCADWPHGVECAPRLHFELCHEAVCCAVECWLALPAFTAPDAGCVHTLTTSPAAAWGTHVCHSSGSRCTTASSWLLWYRTPGS